MQLGDEEQMVGVILVELGWAKMGVFHVDDDDDGFMEYVNMKGPF